ncbi:MAG TPA: transcription-repair coupling factor [Thermodesulfobacteriota bacterium]|nr:transcription-repair coupling factor [Thermodesulfobacteriota bacterium]
MNEKKYIDQFTALHKFQHKNTFYNPILSSTLDQLLNKMVTGEKILKLSGLKVSSKFYIASTLAKKIERPILYLVSSKEIGKLAAKDMAFYLGEKPPILLKKELGLKNVLFSSQKDEYGERINWLYSASEKKPALSTSFSLRTSLSNGMLIAEAPALFQRTIPIDVLRNSAIKIQKGSDIIRDNFISKLIQMGYLRSDFVEKVGDVSVRGAIIDLFSPGFENPIRLELYGDAIHSIRFFRVDDQKSLETTEGAAILPVSEVILTDEAIKQSLSYVRKKAEEQEIPASTKISLLEEIEKGTRFPEIEWFLPSFYQNLSTAFDYIPKDTLIIFDNPDEISKSVKAYLSSLSDIKTSIKKHLKPTPEFQELYLTEDQLHDEILMFQRIFIEDVEIYEAGIESIRFNTETANVQKEASFDSAFEFLSFKIQEWQALGIQVNLVLQTDIERKKIKDILTKRGIKNVNILIGSVSSGFIFPEGKIALITEKEISGERKQLKPTKSKDVPSVFITSFSELKPGDFVVHVDFGIGIFRGLRRLKLENFEGDFLECEYEGGDKIYVPVDKLKLVQRYIGDKKPRIDKLGHQNWKRVIKRVKKAVENVAKELLQLYAERKAEKGFQFSRRDSLFREFEFTFTYEETQDQEAAIYDVMSDMESPKAMDRLICGDVGFGKTEVAVRAAFKAVMDGKQVAILVPTTLLAYQHYISFTERLKGYPVVTEMLSRFKTQKEIREIQKKLENGTIDIIIGTHKLLGNKVKFKDLGLVVIDEEHRFGVAHKEKLRKLKKGVEVLALSATPIPRTLQLSLAGIRDISLINTPPEGRQSIENYVSQFNGDIIRDAIRRELNRSGSVFFIHNRIEDILRIAETIRELVPEAKIDITHGRMEEEKLEKAILRFIQGKTDVLVTTAIVEAGLDIPRANTIIINDAHAFGLADLYQLRGRVGRAEKKAYAYFLIPGVNILTPEAKRRLKAIAELRELGSGFKLALSDLEIRGAGNIFGTEQSGHIAEVGLELYLEMLDKAIKELKKEKTHIEYEPEVRLNTPAFLPDDYISDGAERLLFYKELSSVMSEKDIKEIKNELEDRFGELPEPALNLVKVIELKLLLKKLLAQRIEIRNEETVIVFLEASPFYHHFTPSGRLKILYKHGRALEEIKKRLKELK